MKYNKKTLKKVEELLELAGYRLRRERGNFAPGHCVIEQSKVVVINKYLDVEAQLLALVDLLPQLDLTIEDLPQETQGFYRDLSALNKEV
mgnify:CR=1 FL=1